MAIEQYLQEAVAQKNKSHLQKWESVSAMAMASDNANGCFDCNICLDSVQEPVVTLCGHLYCWPCIYKWIHLQNSSPAAQHQHPQCPVCKADVSQTTLVSLYARGPTSTRPESESESKSNMGLVIPSRPRACGVHTHLASTTPMTPHPNQQLRRNPYPQPFDLRSTTTSNVLEPTVGMFGEMVYARVFGNSETSLYAYPNSYFTGSSNSSPRVRRQEIQAGKSLNRISFFLFCCVLFCLIFF